MYRLLSSFFFAAAVVFLGLAAYSYFAPPPGPRLEVAETDIDVGTLPVGRQTEVAVKVHNTSGQPMRILGLAEC